jgi:hypothetical protein
MTGPEVFGGWDPFRPLDSLAAMWSTAPLTAGPAAMYRSLFDTARKRLVGRTFTVRTRTADVRLRLAGLDARLDPLALSVGQMEDVRIVAEELTWAEHRIERAVAVAHNVHVRPAGVPELVAAPVELTVTVSAATVDALLHARVPWLVAHVGEDATPTLRLRRRADLGQAEVEVRPDGSTLWFRLRAVTVRGRRWSVPGRLPAYPVRLAPLPSGLRLTRIEPGPGVVHLHGLLPAWSKQVPTGRLNDLLGQIKGAASLLDLSGWTRRPGTADP